MKAAQLENFSNDLQYWSDWTIIARDMIFCIFSNLPTEKNGNVTGNLSQMRWNYFFFVWELIEELLHPTANSFVKKILNFRSYFADLWCDLFSIYVTPASKVNLTIFNPPNFEFGLCFSSSNANIIFFGLSCLSHPNCTLILFCLQTHYTRKHAETHTIRIEYK